MWHIVRRPMAALASMAALLTSGCGGTAPPAAPVEVVDQGPAWDPVMRALYHFTPQGSQMIPRDWFLALERAEDDTLFSSPAHLRQFGLIYAPDDAGTGLNPFGLPIGFASEPAAAPGGAPWLGLTCAACHAGEVTHRGRRLRVEGAPAAFDFDRFGAALNAAVQAQRADPAKFGRFQARLLRPAEPAVFTAYAAASARHWATQRPALAAGPGRVDALGQILNTLAVLQLGEPANAVPPAAPTSYPFLWTTPQQDWVQWAPIAASPIARNAGEVLGVFGHAQLTPPSPGEPPRFTSTVRFRELKAMEDWLDVMTPPRWPEAVLGPLDEGRWRQGERLVAESGCLGCHSVPPAYRRTDPALAVGGQTFIQTRAVPLPVVGTDPAYTQGLTRRTLRTGGAADLFGGRTEVPAAAFFGTMVGAVTRSGLGALGLTPQETLAYHGFRFSPPRAPGAAPEPWPTDPARFAALKAGPLAGLWATGPFLHNGSVPTLDDLLRPPAERPAVFWTGAREIDAVKVGFVSDEAPGLFRFDTRLPGNGNGGHAFPATPFTPAQRAAVIEYLKDPERFAAPAPRL